MTAVEVQAGTRTIELILPFKGDDHKSYSGVIGKADGTPVLNTPNLPVRSKGALLRASWRFPAKSLPPGEYILTLYGINASGEREDLAEYQFRILPK